MPYRKYGKLIAMFWHGRIFKWIALGILFVTIIREQGYAAENEASLPTRVTSIEIPGIHNAFSVQGKFFSGSTPENEEAFAALQKLGVKTIISVDGGRPDVELARKYGLRYVHLPHGYDGISTNVQSKLIAAANLLPGPIYLHCHHGKHRGPAAVAILCRSQLGWSMEEAQAWLTAAGTSTNYVGLYKDVRDFKTQDSKSIGISELPETAKVSGLIEAMVGIDERWNHLKSIRQAGYQAPDNKPDLVPANEAVLLWEHYREAKRLAESVKKGRQFLQDLEAAEATARSAEKLLRTYANSRSTNDKVELDKIFDQMGKACSTCHRNFRD